MTEKETPITVSTEDKPMAWADWHPLESLRREVDRLFEDFDWRLGRSPFRRPLFDFDSLKRRTSGLATAVDLVEKDDAYEVSAELPGLDEKDLKVEVVNGTLRMAGEKREEKEEKRKDYYLRERHFGAFERSFVLPDDVDADHIEAAFRKGVLTVRLPRRPEAKPASKQVAIKVG